MEPLPWRVGTLARRSGVSVRTLHHYHQIGLLSPALRTESGHRLYAAADVARLQQIRSLTALGFSLEEVARCLDEPGMSLARVVGLHIEQLTRRLELERELLRRLEMVRAGLAVEADVSVEKLLEIMEVMNMFEKHYSPEQLAELEARRDQLGPEGMARAQQQWTDLLARVDKAVAADLDPRDPAAREMAREWDALIQGFTGGNKAIEQSLKKMYGENPDVAANHGFRPDPRVMAWLARARD